jgi:hypothetical protein
MLQQEISTYSPAKQTAATFNDAPAKALFNQNNGCFRCFTEAYGVF